MSESRHDAHLALLEESVVVLLAVEGAVHDEDPVGQCTRQVLQPMCLVVAVPQQPLSNSAMHIAASARPAHGLEVAVNEAHDIVKQSTLLPNMICKRGEVWLPRPDVVELAGVAVVDVVSELDHSV